MAIKYEWATPPARTDGGSRPDHLRQTRQLNEFAAMLRKNPGQYALVGEKYGAGGGAQFRRRGLEVATRKRPDGLYDVYVKAP